MKTQSLNLSLNKMSPNEPNPNIKPMTADNTIWFVDFGSRNRTIKQKAKASIKRIPAKIPRTTANSNISFIFSSHYLLLMPMPVMNIGHVVVLMLFGEMFMLMRVDSLCIVMSMRSVIVAVAVFMK